MDKLLEVREFDSITGNAEFESDDNYKYLEAKAFQDLIDFIHEFSGDDENADALDFMRISYLLLERCRRHLNLCHKLIKAIFDMGHVHKMQLYCCSIARLKFNLTMTAHLIIHGIKQPDF